MEEEIIIDKIEWTAPEYKHKDKSIDFLWTIGLVALLVFGLAVWKGSYLFAVFVAISGFTLVFFSVREPEEVSFSIETNGLTMGKDKYSWKNIKGFDIKKEEDYNVLLIEINKYLLPVYTIPLPGELIPKVKESLLKVIPSKELQESKSMKFMEKIGF